MLDSKAITNRLILGRDLCYTLSLFSPTVANAISDGAIFQHTVSS